MSTSIPPSDDKKEALIDDDRTVIVGASDKATVIMPALEVPSASGATAGNIVALPVGTRLSEFEITGLIGEGGFGIVYAALDHSLERDVAIKEYMPSSLAARTEGYTVSVRAERYADTFHAGLKSFVNEAKLLARFDHPSLVKVFRFWEVNGTAYMAMPIYRGVTLKQRLKQMSEPPSEAWLRALLTPLLEALDVIHAEHCFHRDIAPDNILLIEDERPVLLDFGAARRVISDLTQNLTVILKPGYAPVEQYAEVSSMKQGPWTDIYALAAVMYYAITGRAPDPSIGRLMGDQMKSLRELVQGRYSDQFINAIDTALKVHPDERPCDVAAFRALLGESNSGTKSVPLRPAEASGQRGKPSASADASQVPHRRWGLNAVFAIAALVFIGGGAYLLQTLMSPRAPKTPETVQVAPPDKAVTIKPLPPVTSKEQTPVPPPVATQPAHIETKIQPVPEPVTPSPVLPSMSPAENPKTPSRVSPSPRLSPREKPALPVEGKSSAAALEGRERIRNLLQNANDSLARSDYKLTHKYVDEVLASEPNNVRALKIKMQAHKAERAAFESIQIE
ncbi:MAG: protein kinase [Pseudomonadota bacterium]